MSRASAENQAYRRGQALGFTVAELFTLLLFLVLLILAAVEQHHTRTAQEYERTAREYEHNWDRVQKDLGEAKRAAAALAEKNRRLREYFGVPDDFGDDFNDLVQPKNGMSYHLRQKMLMEKAAAADEAIRFLNQDPSLAKDNGNTGPEYDPKSLPTRAKSCVEENERLRGEVANVEKRYGGAGTVYPSCWVTATGSAEFVLNVDLLSNPDGGRLMIHDGKVPGHENDKALLFRDVRFAQPLPDSDFLDDTRQFYDFGTKQRPECRFFVRVNDRTAPQDKSTFKNLLLTVEKNFYKAWSQSN
jgi:hypothetical protein